MGKKILAIIGDLEFVLPFGIMVVLWVMGNPCWIVIIVGAILYIVVNLFNKDRSRITIFGTTNPDPPTNPGDPRK